MLRSAFIVFIAGWLLWFSIDKPPVGQLGLPGVSDSITENFQRAFNMLKAGHPDMAFVYIWDAHYILLSLLGGILVAVIYGSVSDHLGRRRMRRHFRAPEQVEKSAGVEVEPPEQSNAPAERRKTSG
jgi:hypothetical protein